jgi:hypothetical protein
MLLARLAAPATLTLALLAAPLVATTQSTRNVARIGWLTRSVVHTVNVEAFRQGGGRGSCAFRGLDLPGLE